MKILIFEASRKISDGRKISANFRKISAIFRKISATFRKISANLYKFYLMLTGFLDHRKDKYLLWQIALFNINNINYRGFGPPKDAPSSCVVVFDLYWAPLYRWFLRYQRWMHPVHPRGGQGASTPQLLRYVRCRNGCCLSSPLARKGYRIKPGCALHPLLSPTCLQLYIVSLQARAQESFGPVPFNSIKV